MKTIKQTKKNTHKQIVQMKRQNTYSRKNIHADKKKHTYTHTHTHTKIELTDETI